MEMIYKLLAGIVFVIAGAIFLIGRGNSAAVENKKVELYYFGIDNCFACKLQKPIIMQLKTQGFNFEIINATYPTPEVQVLLDKYAVTKYPTIVIITTDGKVIRIVGFRPLKMIRELL